MPWGAYPGTFRRAAVSDNGRTVESRGEFQYATGEGAYQEYKPWFFAESDRQEIDQKAAEAVDRDPRTERRTALIKFAIVDIDADRLVNKADYACNDIYQHQLEYEFFERSFIQTGLLLGGLMWRFLPSVCIRNVFSHNLSSLRCFPWRPMPGCAKPPCACPSEDPCRV